MGLTRITLLLAEIMLTASFTGWQAECPTPAGRMSGSSCRWWSLPVPVVLLLANQLNLLNLSDSTAHTLGVNLTRLRLVINMLVLLLVGACVQRGRSGGVYRSAGATSGALLGRLRSAQRTASEHAAGGHADAAGQMYSHARWPSPEICPQAPVLALIGSPCFVWLVRRRG
ncbi:iron(III) dicitrate transport system, permease protein [Escherichia coli]|uniref:Iron(III) dicitrate transport system, permease protein n=1 Tax=Escherichia coli TaxID=562 RepID=A0A2X1NAP2_ECOLX|nr:iron(III) dicitrate transport system, permease protein [Escherichia coli]